MSWFIVYAIFSMSPSPALFEDALLLGDDTRPRSYPTKALCEAARKAHPFPVVPIDRKLYSYCVQL